MRTRNWRYVRDEVMGRLSVEGDKLFYPPHKEDALSLTGHHERKLGKGTQRAEKRKSTKSSPTVSEPRPAAPPTETSKISTPDVSADWDKAPAPESGLIVHGLQGHRTVGGGALNRLLRHPSKLREASCVMWTVRGAKIISDIVDVRRHPKGFSIAMPTGQVIAPD